MYKPGIYRGMPMDEYLRIPAVSATLLTNIIFSCAEKALFCSPFNPTPPPSDDTDESDAGTIGHALFLEGNDEKVAVIDPWMYLTKGSGNVPVGWGNKEIKAARDYERAQGRTPILKDKYEIVKAMVDSARNKVERVKAKQPAVWEAFQPNGGESETTILFEYDGMLCKIRPDRLNATHTHIFDAKFTGVSAEPNSFGRAQMIRMGYYVSAAFYKLALGGGDNISYTFIVIENKAPYLASLIGMTPTLFDIGMRKVEWALTRWKQCVATGLYPGYPDDICYPDAPTWLEADWIERETDDALANGIAYGSQP